MGTRGCIYRPIGIFTYVTWDIYQLIENTIVGSRLLSQAYGSIASIGRSGSDSLVLCMSFSWEVTWLILPVVICLSQRLSHACLSVNNSYETANGSLNQLSNT